MERPTRYYVPYENAELLEKATERVRRQNPGMENPEEATDPVDYWVDRDFENLSAARRFARQHGSEVHERCHMEQDSYGLWDYGDRVVPEKG